VPSPSIAIAPSISEYFQEVVTDAIRTRRVEATQAASHYIVGLLVSFAHPDEEVEATFDRPLTFLLREALEATGAERFRRLRALGDGVLYALGFFGEAIEVRGVDRGYVVTVGSTAYHGAASMLRRGAREPADDGPDVLVELAEKFDRFAGVLSEVAEGSLAKSAHDDGSIVKLYERWLRTGSARLAAELGARGLVPNRGGSGLN
jgi:hypothetical protein